MSGSRLWIWNASLSVECLAEWGDRADMRIAPTTTFQAVLGIPSRFPFADEATSRVLLATAGTDNGH